MSSGEFAEYLALDRLQPIGQYGAYWRAALIASTVAEANRNTTVRPTPFTVDDFMPGEAVEPETDEERAAQLATKVDAAMRAAGGIG